jgi:hypothetical protein
MALKADLTIMSVGKMTLRALLSLLGEAQL